MRIAWLLVIPVAVALLTLELFQFVLVAGAFALAALVVFIAASLMDEYEMSKAELDHLAELAGEDEREWA